MACLQLLAFCLLFSLIKVYIRRPARVSSISAVRNIAYSTDCPTSGFWEIESHRSCENLVDLLPTSDIDLPADANAINDEPDANLLSGLDPKLQAVLSAIEDVDIKEVLGEQDTSKLPILLKFAIRVLEQLRDSEAEIQLASKKKDSGVRGLRPEARAASLPDNLQSPNDESAYGHSAGFKTTLE